MERSSPEAQETPHAGLHQARKADCIRRSWSQTLVPPRCFCFDFFRCCFCLPDLSRTRPFPLEPEPSDLDVHYPFHERWVSILVEDMPHAETQTMRPTAQRHIRIYTDRQTGLKFRVDTIEGHIFVHTCANVSPTCHDLDHFAQVYPEPVGTAQVFPDSDSDAGR
jgi:hypothetical protein